MIQYSFMFLFGCSLSSFFKVIIDRTHYDLKWWKGRSYCPKCKHKLKSKDLIPILSQLILKNKCRYCQHKIGWNYLLSELFGGLSFVVITYLSTPTNLLPLLITWCILWTSSWSDLLYYELNLWLFYPLLVNWLIIHSNQWPSINLIPTLYFIILGCYLEYTKSQYMGCGDCYILAWLSLQLNYQEMIYLLFISSTFACLYAVVTLNFNQKIPFISYLISGFLSIQIINFITLYL